MFHFYIPWNCQKTFGFLTFSGVIEMDDSVKMSYGFIDFQRQFFKKWESGIELQKKRDDKEDNNLGKLLRISHR